MHGILTYLLAIVYCLSLAQSANFTELSMELISKILSWNPDRNAARMHTKTNKDYQDEIRTVHQLESIIADIRSINDSVSWSLVSNLTQKLQFSDLFIVKRRWMTDYIAEIFYSNPEKFRRAMHAFGYKSITFTQFDSLSFDELSLSLDAKQKLKILIGCSRAMIPLISAALNQSYTKIIWVGLCRVYFHFPWIRLRRCFSRQAKGYTNHLYLGYLMEFIWKRFHKEMNIPSQESIWYITRYDDEYKQLQFLKLLMDRYHLRIDQKNAFWHRRMPGLHGAYSFVWILDEANRLNDIFLPNNVSFKHQFMTEFIVDVAEYLKIRKLNVTNQRTLFPFIMAHSNIDIILELMWNHYLLDRVTDFNKLASILTDVFRFDLMSHNSSMIRNRHKEWSLAFWAKLWRVVVFPFGNWSSDEVMALI